jgi:hypothetical protein
MYIAYICNSHTHTNTHNVYACVYMHTQTDDSEDLEEEDTCMSHEEEDTY